jgi:hypothetical protein
MTFDQQEFDIRCEWGAHGVAVLAPISDVVIIIDVLSFSTSVDVAVTQGAMVFPYRWRDDTARAYAVSVGATLAGPGRHPTRYSLSPCVVDWHPQGHTDCVALAEWRHFDVSREARPRPGGMSAQRGGRRGGRTAVWRQDRGDPGGRTVEGRWQSASIV